MILITSRAFPFPRPRLASKPNPVTSYKCMPATSQEPTTRETTFDLFRRWGYLQASLDPLGQLLPPAPFPIAGPAPDEDSPDTKEARRIYASSVGAEFMHIPSTEKRAWIQQRLESPFIDPDAATATIPAARILTGLIRADLFEQVIQQRYLGTKRFSLEGLTVLIPFLNQVFATVSAAGVTRALIAMAHVVEGTVERYDWPGLHGFNFILNQSLGGGGVASLRYDPQGKAHAQMLMDFPVKVPAGWVTDGVVSG